MCWLLLIFVSCNNDTNAWPFFTKRFPGKLGEAKLTTEVAKAYKSVVVKVSSIKL